MIKPETVNKTPITQPKPLNTETIKTEPKNLKTSSTEVFEGILKNNNKIRIMIFYLLLLTLQLCY